jgi:hypothetical protein
MKLVRIRRKDGSSYLAQVVGNPLDPDTKRAYDEARQEIGHARGMLIKIAHNRTIGTVMVGRALRAQLLLLRAQEALRLPSEYRQNPRAPTPKAPPREVPIVRCVTEVDKEAYPDSDEARVAEIWLAGQKITGGHGFWGSTELYHHKNPKDMVGAWTAGCGRAGLCDIDIVLYGDWTDGRHLADSIEYDTSPSEFADRVERAAKDRGRAYIEKENETYFDRDEVIYAAYVFLHVIDDLPFPRDNVRLVRTAATRSP